jgi:tetratricopeptide (TPR) repeat protein
LAALYHKLERHDEAMDQARAILDKDPGNIQALRIEGAIQGIQGNDEEAKNIFERITNMNLAEGSGENYERFMIESPDSRYCLDLVPPPAAVLPEAPEAKTEAKQAAVDGVPQGDLLGLLRYLVDLAGNLPEPALGDFMRSEARAEMKRLIGALEKPHG